MHMLSILFFRYLVLNSQIVKGVNIFNFQLNCFFFCVFGSLLGLLSLYICWNKGKSWRLYGLFLIVQKVCFYVWWFLVVTALCATPNKIDKLGISFWKSFFPLDFLRSLWTLSAFVNMHVNELNILTNGQELILMRNWAFNLTSPEFEDHVSMLFLWMLNLLDKCVYWLF